MRAGRFTTTAPGCAQRWASRRCANGRNSLSAPLLTSLIHVAGHNLGLLMRLLIGAGTPKEAVARGWYFFVLLRTTDGATYAAILEVFVENSAGPALIIFTTGCDHRLDRTITSSTGC